MASIAVNAARAEDGLAVVAGGGYLSFSEIAELEYTSLYLCRETRRQVARKVRVTEETPHTLWCRAKGPIASGSDSGDDGSDSDSSDDGGSDTDFIDCDSGDGSDGVGDSSRQMNCEARSDSTGVTIGSNSAESVEPTGDFSEGAMGLGTDGNISSPGGSPDASGPNSKGQNSHGARGFNMYPMVKAMLFINKMSTSDVINAGHGLIGGGNDGDHHHAQRRGTDLQAKARKGKQTASQSGISSRFSRTGKALDKQTVCSTGECRSADIGFPRPTPVPTATSDSLVASRVPLARVTTIKWLLPATDLTARIFLWRDGVKEIHFGEYGSMYSEFNPSFTFEVLSFAECCNTPLKPGSVPLPPGLNKIRFGAAWSLDLHGARENWPDSLDSIRFPRHFNQPLMGEGVGLPLGLREIIMGGKFNQPLIGVEWPPLLRKLTLSDLFNQSLEGVKFPSGLSEIELGDSFNHEIGGVVWPKGLKTLVFGTSFDKALVSPGAEGGAALGRKHPLPAGLKTLYFGYCFNQPLSGYELPDGLEGLGLGWLFDFLSSVRWPSSLKCLFPHCPRCFAKATSPIELPPKLKTLKFHPRFNSPLTTIAFPPTLKVLVLRDAFNHPIGGADGDAPLLPDGLNVLQLGTCFNQSFENVRLPVGLTSLYIRAHSRFNQGLAGVMWPPGLEWLSLGDSFNQPMEGTTFPETLFSLSFGTAFDYSLKDVNLPDALTYLVFRGDYPASHLREFHWPPSLRSLRIGSSRFGCLEALAGWVAQRL